MLQRIITILLTPVDPRSLRQYLAPPRPGRRRTDYYDTLPDAFFERLARHSHHAVQRYGDWVHARALLPGLDSLARWEAEEAAVRLATRRALLRAKPLATVFEDNRGRLRRRVTDREDLP